MGSLTVRLHGVAPLRPVEVVTGQLLGSERQQLHHDARNRPTRWRWSWSFDGSGIVGHAAQLDA